MHFLKSDLSPVLGLTAECRVGVGRLCVIGTESGNLSVGHGATASRGLCKQTGSKSETLHPHAGQPKQYLCGVLSS
jgi:hypothetical protein